MAPPPQTAGGSNGVAIAGLVLAILALPGSFVPFIGFGVALLALILGILGIKKGGETGTGKGAGIAAVIIASLGLMIGGLVTACTGCAIAGGAATLEAGNTQAQELGYVDMEDLQNQAAAADLNTPEGQKIHDDLMTVQQGMAKGFLNAVGADEIADEIDREMNEVDSADLEEAMDQFGEAMEKAAEAAEAAEKANEALEEKAAEGE